MSAALKRLVRRTLLGPLLLEHGPTNSRAVALTFDDGPHEEFTPRVLETLKRHGARATFFLVGANAARLPHLVRAIIDAGHEIGNHSQTHAEFAALDLAGIGAEFRAADQTFAGLGLRQRITRYRPPKGVLNLRTLTWATLNRHRYAMWNRDPEDFAATSLAPLREFFRQRPIEAGDIVLLHDKSAVAAEFVEHLLGEIAARGLRACTLEELVGQGEIR
jgi:peptidoglycan-N-acetylglucosamine deacetylase